MPALDYLDPDQRTEVQRLARDAALHDGIEPLSEHVVLHLRDGGDEQDLHYLTYRDGRLAGYAHLDLTDQVDGPSAEIVVHPDFRRRGVGRGLMDEVIGLAGPRLRLWSHGDLTVAADLADALGFQRIRTLIQMRSTLPSSLSSPPGIHTRPFIRHQDEEAWLALNARIFSAHPEQGQWTREDLERRLSEGWFDPDGFLIHESEGVMRGFCWTKVHGTHGHGHDVIGEIYVVGVDPAYQGRGLGRALTLAGLQHLTTAQVSGAMLYVDASNAAAIALYTDLGFSESGRDVMYRAPVTEVDQTKKRTGK